ncbi:DUF2220 family protein [Roseateles saccharophilus]|uniref:Uncharacterized protein DUF2220 n=1 Tax=Roseateles saccharophilus TaxID=304 RepID=A0A4R3UB72_ROSSA|nr:DUF2220 family protein [Roseateles saccharophilus]MDG0835793.1 hypothetical protein [Roseateles saccharophilus]TCU83745.1 uncharacterized protein DUF2220 [Roseateles saccharophilus]
MSLPAHPLQRRLAHALLRKAERSEGGRTVSLPLDAQTLPELHDAPSPQALAHLELLLDGLAKTGWVRLKADKARAFQTLADRRPALLLLDAAALAEWSGFEPATPRWSRQLVQALREHATLLAVPDAPALLDYLLRSPLPAFQGQEPAACAAVLNALAADCRAAPALTPYLREISARHFRGHSKVLDAREELLRLLGAGEASFLEAPIQLLVDLPEDWTGDEVLFIENGVSFERMAGQRQPPWAHTALLYAAGFRSGARRLRERKGSSIYWRGRMSAANIERFETWLYGGTAEPAVGFYGDLDFAGLAILAQLRMSFPTCSAWRPGYDALLSALGSGHAPGDAGKERQQDPVVTGCAFADEVLLPALRTTGRCMDQELWPGATTKAG